VEILEAKIRRIIFIKKNHGENKLKFNPNSQTQIAKEEINDWK